MSSMGMDKSGTQALAASQWVKLTVFTVRTGFPGTSLVDSTLVMDGPAVGDIRFRGGFTFAYGTQQFRVVRNGTEVVAGPVNAGTVGTTAGVVVADGDTLELQGYANYYQSIAREVAGGSAVTYLEFNQTTQDHPAAAGPMIQWNSTSSLAVESAFGAGRTVAWATSAGIGLESELAADLTIDWSTSADLYLGQFYGLDAAATISWSMSADMLHVRKPEPPQRLWENTAVSVHTVDGRLLGAVTCHDMSGITWARERREVSGCDIDVMTQADPDLLEDLRPWVHWVTVWHDDRPVWTGPIQVVKIGSRSTKITARDPSTFMWRTRVPITRTWADTDPTEIAATVIRSMNELHSIKADPIVLPGITESFTYASTTDSRMVNQMMDDLTKLGLEWTVSSGRFILGEFSPDPVAELDECDFLVEIERVRDGSGTFNDVRVQGQNWAQTAVAPLAGLHLQTLVSLDDVFGVSNIQKAARLYAGEVSAIRDSLVVPSGASLHPEAEISLDDLVPGKVIRVNAAGITDLMYVDQVQVVASPGSFDTQVTLVAVQHQGELAELVQGR